MIPVARPVFDEEMKKAALDALSNEKFVLGESVFKFEEEFARYLGIEYAVSVCNGTDALKLALVCVGVRPGDEVVTTASSYVATANAVIHANAIPRFADIGGDYNIDASKVSALVSKGKTRAVLPVHLYGLPAQMDEIKEVALKNGLAVVEDACQAHGSTYKGRKAGSLGEVGCFSFYTTKNMMVGGDGGMITTSDEKIAGTAAKLRNAGRVMPENNPGFRNYSQYEHDEVGFNNRLNTVNAAIGRVQLRRLDAWNEQRRQAAALYRQKLGGLEQVVLPPQVGYALGNYHLHAIKAERRDELANFLAGKGVQCSMNFPLPVPLQPVYKRVYGYKQGQFPLSEDLSSKVLCLPMFAGITEREIGVVCDAVREFYSNA